MQIFHDNATSLDWMFGPNQDMDKEAAAQFVVAMNKENSMFPPWRLPTLEEIASLYEAGGLNSMFPYRDEFFWCLKGGEMRSYFFDLDGRVEKAGSSAYCMRVIAVRGKMRPRFIAR